MMKKTFAFFWLFLSFQVQAQIDPALATLLQQELNTQVTSGGNHGVSAHLILQDGSTWSGTAGVDGQSQPMTDSTVFISASISKLNIAILLLMLAEDSLVNLDDSWHFYVPGLNVAFDTTITIRQLLNHTSGIADYLEVPANYGYITNDFSHFYTPPYILENIVSGIPDFPSGTGFNYSNSNYLLAAWVAEAATPNDLKDELRTRIWNPLGMNHTYYGAYEPITDPRAGVWWNFGAGLTNYSMESDTSMLSYGYGTDNVVTCPTDLARLVEALLNDSLLSPTSMAEMLTFVPQSLPGQWVAGYGLGIHHLLGQTVDTVLGHNGKFCNNSDAFHSQMCGFTLAVMSNTETLWQGIYNPLYDILRNYFMCNAIPVANFQASTRVACTGVAVTFSDSSTNFPPASWYWQFPGGTLTGGTTATDSMPQVFYSVPGSYPVTYTVSTTAGSDSITKSGYLTIHSNMAMYTGFAEGFETATLPDTNWNISNTGGQDWAVTSLAAATGNQSVYVNNFANIASNKSELFSPSFDISGFADPKLSFKIAYRQIGASSDNLQVLSSTDCGRTWFIRLNRTGAGLATVTPPDSTPLLPSPSQFQSYTLNLSSLAGSTNVRFKFVFSADAANPGNNIFLDDVTVFDAPVGLADPLAESHWSVFPNPSVGKINVRFSTSEHHVVSIRLLDPSGRVIREIPSRNLPAGEHHLALEGEPELEAGVYLIAMDLDGIPSVKKAVIRHGSP